MSVSGIFSSGLSTYNPDNIRSQVDQFRKEFQQLGKDLQSGDLAAAQADFATLQNNRPASAATAQNANPIAQAFDRLSKDLQSGNLSAAQQDFSAIQQDNQSQAAQAPAARGHHHHHRSGGHVANPAAQALDQLSQAIESGDISAAKQAYSTLQQDFQQIALSQPSSAGSAVSALGKLSVTA